MLDKAIARDDDWERPLPGSRSHGSVARAHRLV